jgi:hypothetical protein
MDENQLQLGWRSSKQSMLSDSLGGRHWSGSARSFESMSVSFPRIRGASGYRSRTLEEGLTTDGHSERLVRSSGEVETMLRELLAEVGRLEIPPEPLDGMISDQRASDN